MGTAAELILNALKLEVSHLPLPNESLEATTAASKALAVASQLADLSGQGFPLDAESIAAGMLVDAVAAQRLSLELVDDRLGPAVADLIEDIIKVRKLPSRVDLYDDIASRYSPWPLFESHSTVLWQAAGMTSILQAVHVCAIGMTDRSGKGGR